MPKRAFKEIRIKLPNDMVNARTGKEIIGLLLDKALSKREYYLSRCKEMEQKYGVGFESFKKRVEDSEEEVFGEWDDLLLWEGYELSYKEWKGKYEELKKCME